MPGLGTAHMSPVAEIWGSVNSDSVLIANLGLNCRWLNFCDL